jgi:hypothetical protein
VTVVDVGSLGTMQEYNSRLITEIKEIAGVGNSVPYGN